MAIYVQLRRNTFMRRFIAIGFMIASVLFSPHDNASAQGGNVLKYVEVELPVNIDPIHGIKEYTAVKINELMGRGLYIFDEFGDPQPILADRASFSGDSLQVDVTLRPNLRWSDGQRLTANDVVFSYEVYNDPGNHYINISSFSNIRQVTRVDESTVRFLLLQKDSNILSHLSFTLLPRQILGGRVYPPGSAYAMYRQVDCGPFVFQEKTQAALKLRENENYYIRDRLPANRIRGVEVHEQANRALHAPFLLAGNYDLVPDVLPAHQPIISADVNFRLVTYPTQQWTGICFNCDNLHPLLQNRDIREAMVYAFNREEAMKSHYLGHGTVISGPFSPSSPYYNFSVKPREFDPQAARKKLDDLGYTAGSDGIRQTADGRRLVFNILYQANVPEPDRDALQDFRSQLRQVGIGIELDPQPTNVFYERVEQSRNFDMALVTWNFDAAGNIYPLFSRQGTMNWGAFDHPEVEKLLTSRNNAEDPNVLQAVSYELHRVINREVPYIFLWGLQRVAGHHRKIKCRDSVTIKIHPYFFFTFIDQWYIEE